MRIEINTDNMTGARLDIALLCSLYEDEVKPSQAKEVFEWAGFSQESIKSMLGVLFNSPPELMPLMTALNKKDVLSADDIHEIIDDFIEGLSKQPW